MFCRKMQKTWNYHEKSKIYKKQFILSKNFYLLPFDGLRWKFLKMYKIMTLYVVSYLDQSIYNIHMQYLVSLNDIHRVLKNIC